VHIQTKEIAPASKTTIPSSTLTSRGGLSDQLFRATRLLSTPQTRPIRISQTRPGPRHSKSIVIPVILKHVVHPNTIGLPFARGYAKHLGPDYGIPAKAFLVFIDKPNLLNRGHHAYGYVQKVGCAIHPAYRLDSTHTLPSSG
jgi:hypothetical protein